MSDKKYIRAFAYELEHGAFIDVVYPCDCEKKTHKYHWKFKFRILGEGKIELPAIARTWEICGYRIPRELQPKVYDFMEIRASRVAMKCFDQENMKKKRSRRPPH